MMTLEAKQQMEPRNLFAIQMSKLLGLTLIGHFLGSQI